MNNEAQTESIEVDIETARGEIKLGEALRRLQHHADFKTVIEEGYFKENAYRLVGLKANGDMQSPERQELIIRAIDGIGELQQHFNATLHRAAQAERAIEEGEEQLVALAEEDAEGAA
jgi:hypothetical protein